MSSRINKFGPLEFVEFVNVEQNKALTVNLPYTGRRQYVLFSGHINWTKNNGMVVIITYSYDYNVHVVPIGTFDDVFKDFTSFSFRIDCSSKQGLRGNLYYVGETR